MNSQISQYTIFTWMQDSSNRSDPSSWNTFAKRKYMYPDLRRSPRNEASAKKNILLLITYN
jgi:hypothetical protein